MSDPQPPSPAPPASSLPPGGDLTAGLGGAPLDPDMYNLKGKSKARVPIIIGVVVLILGGGGFAYWRVKTGHEQAKQLAAFMTDFQNIEEQSVGTFWVCLLGKDANPSMIGDNLTLGKRLDATFMGDPENYPAKVIENCVPRLKEVDAKVDALDAPGEFKEMLVAYKKSVNELGPGATYWAEQAKKRISVIKSDKALTESINAFHSVSGTTFPPEAIAYDRFLRCAFPHLDKFKDTQEYLQHLFEECKKPEFAPRVRDECTKLLTDKEGKPDKNFKATFKKFGSDDRDSSGWADCMRKARKGAKVDDMAQFGQAFVGYMKAGGEVRKQGAAMLKKD
jgi:hypothetical protein